MRFAANPGQAEAIDDSWEAECVIAHSVASVALDPMIHMLF